MLPLLWAQATPGSAAGQDADALAALALRRWCSGLTLTSPEPTPRPFGLVALAAGLLALLVLAAVAQGPGRTLRQFFDLPGNVRLIAQAIRRTKGSARLIAGLLGSTVLVWSVHQMLSYSRDDRLEELVLLRKVRSPWELATDHGSLAALIPQRDLFGLGDNLVLVVIAAALVFRLSADRWSDPLRGRRVGAGAVPPWASLCWGGAWLYAAYRLIGAVMNPGGTPLGGCVVLEAGLLPLLTLMVDGLLLSWVVVELRDADRGAYSESGVNVPGVLALLPGAMVACLLGLPGRYAAEAVWLLAMHTPQFVVASGLVVMIKGWGVLVLQGAALPFLGLAGGLAWSRGDSASALRGYGRLLRAEGGRLVAVATIAAALAGGLSALCYGVLLTFPTSSWLLTAADAYAHYATLPVGLVVISVAVELGERSLPLATLAEERAVKDEPAATSVN